MAKLDRLQYLKSYMKNKQHHLEQGNREDYLFSDIQFFPNYMHDALQRCTRCRLQYMPDQLVKSVCKFCLNK